jgi:hypothetical protein
VIDKGYELPTDPQNPMTAPATSAPAEASQLFVMSQRIHAPATAPVATAAETAKCCKLNYSIAGVKT